MHTHLEYLYACTWNERLPVTLRGGSGGPPGPPAEGAPRLRRRLVSALHTTIFVTAKTTGIDSEREHEKRILTLLISNIHSYATTHQEETQKPVEIGRKQSFWTKWWISHDISFVRAISEKTLHGAAYGYFWDEAFAATVIYSKVPHKISGTASKTTVQLIHAFASISIN